VAPHLYRSTVSASPVGGLRETVVAPHSAVGVRPLYRAERDGPLRRSAPIRPSANALPCRGMTFLAALLVDGALTGAIYALIALSFVVVY
jgi:hypothetical protein